jgi:hypothetical protein
MESDLYDMVLVNTGIYVAIPDSYTTDLINTSIPLYNQQVALLQKHPLKFCLLNTDFLNIV